MGNEKEKRIGVFNICGNLLFRRILCDFLKKKYPTEQLSDFFKIILISGFLSGICNIVIMIWKVPVYSGILFVIAQFLLGMLLAGGYLCQKSILRLVLLHSWYLIGIFWSSFVYIDGSVPRIFEYSTKVQIGEILILVLLLVRIIHKQKTEAENHPAESSKKRFKIIGRIITAVITVALIAGVTELGFEEKYLGMINANMYYGNIDTLKARIAEDHPVIVKLYTREEVTETDTNNLGHYK